MLSEMSRSRNSRLYIYSFRKRELISKSNCRDLDLNPEDQQSIYDIVKQMSTSSEPQVQYYYFCANNDDGVLSWYSAGFIMTEPKEQVVITLTEEGPLKKQASYVDGLTGIYNREGFNQWVKQHYVNGFDKKKHLHDMVVYIDIQRFKIVNDSFGFEEGNRVLRYVANILQEAVGNRGIACRVDSDRFVAFCIVSTNCQEAWVSKLLDRISDCDLPMEITCNAGVYQVNGKHISPSSLIDRAILAQSVIKGSYTRKYYFYSSSLREEILTEQEITGMMKSGLLNEEFVIYYQPQYNHSTGMLIGAEALVRWNHPEKGMISPGMFIPVFEKNGFITQLDQYVFEKVCQFLRKCLDEKIDVVPISINLTRYDIFASGFIERIEEIRKQYDVPSKYIRVEITESAALGNSQFINEAVAKLHSYGYLVEMDDFGSGYSSLNILKDIDFDVIKLDMRFLQKEIGIGKKGGTILSSIVRMVNWLGLPIIAEGVETVNQADFLKSIGSDYIQGFLYSKPLEEQNYKSLLIDSTRGQVVPKMTFVDTLNANDFWSNNSIETLIFSNLVGGAALFEYKDGVVEILRVNQKYLTELGMNLTEKDIISGNPLDHFTEIGRRDYIEMLSKAIESGAEQECETWRTMKSACCGEETICIRSSVRLIGQTGDHYLFYAMIRNITQERRKFDEILNSERRFKAASEQAKIYYWEYTVATKEMRPCFRCMRDLGLPALLKNYPDSAIEMGIFPPETADMYRDWHRQIDAGVPSLEAIIPLTVGRIPFIVRYTTEYDENGNAVKAYGSATLVVDNDELAKGN